VAFVGGLSAHSGVYALSVLGALFRWPIEQRYMFANPFAGIKARSLPGLRCWTPHGVLAKANDYYFYQRIV
jgi:hypothetical protein